MINVEYNGTADIYVTERCNMNCLFCSARKNGLDVSLRDFKKYVDTWVDYGVTHINITGGEDLGLHEVNTAAELVQRSVDPEANIIFGTVTDPTMEDEIQITVIATGFEKTENISSIGVDNIVSKTWEKKINSIPASSEVNNSQNDLDIPSFLRKNKNKNM